MTFETPKTQYSGKVKEITLGKGDKEVTVVERHAIRSTYLKARCHNCPK